MDSDLKDDWERKVVCIKKNGACASGTVVNGCIITAAHVVHDLPYPISIFQGKYPDVSSQPQYQARSALAQPGYQTYETVEMQSYEHDIAIIRPEPLISPDESFIRNDVFPTSPLAQNQVISVTGFGPDRVRNTSGKSSGKVMLTQVTKDTGWGIANANGKQWSYAENGDSGGGGFTLDGENVEFSAVMTGGGTHEKDENSNRSIVTSVFAHREWLKTEMKKMGCGDWSQDPLYQVQLTLQKERVPREGSWDQTPSSAVRKIETELAKWVHLESGEKIAFQLTGEAPKQLVVFKGNPAGAAVKVAVFSIGPGGHLLRSDE